VMSVAGLSLRGGLDGSRMRLFRLGDPFLECFLAKKSWTEVSPLSVAGGDVETILAGFVFG
jgi:hypothetical protein